MAVSFQEVSSEIARCGCSVANEARAASTRSCAQDSRSAVDKASIQGKIFVMRSVSVPSSSMATVINCAANSRRRARPSASRCDINTSASPSRRVIVTGWSSAAAKTSAECLLRSEERRVWSGRSAVIGITTSYSERILKSSVIVLRKNSSPPWPEFCYYP